MTSPKCPQNRWAESDHFPQCNDKYIYIYNELDRFKNLESIITIYNINTSEIKKLLICMACHSKRKSVAPPQFQLSIDQQKTIGFRVWRGLDNLISLRCPVSLAATRGISVDFCYLPLLICLNSGGNRTQRGGTSSKDAFLHVGMHAMSSPNSVYMYIYCQ